MTQFLRGTLVAVFVLLGLSVVIPSWIELGRDLATTSPSLADVPLPPDPKEFGLGLGSSAAAASASQVAAYANATSAYDAYVKAYAERLNAEKSLTRPAAGEDRAVYQLVVKETLAPIFSTCLVALLAFAFAQQALTLLNNHYLVKRNKDPRAIDLF